MQEMLYIEEVEQAAVLLKPRRLEILRHLGRPRSCLELAELLGDTPQKIYYHLKALEQAGLVEKVDERRVRGIIEGFYQARARSYWLSPELVGHPGPRRRSQDQASLGFLLTLAEQLQAEVGHLSQLSGADAPSLGLTALIELRTQDERNAFLHDLQQSIEALARKYGRQEPGEQADAQPPSGHTFRLLVACYPAPSARGDTPLHASPAEPPSDRRDDSPTA